ncbi:hypothetical protein [Pseudomonas fluorescens]|uniref:hypothetical protein n=1 Tax=Pseudomonas fluorescens TaxID=294 RepID=UPI001240974F|nr:hypothetical protein [Pseudomonas fluorescens]
MKTNIELSKLVVEARFRCAIVVTLKVVIDSGFSAEKAYKSFSRISGASQLILRRWVKLTEGLPITSWEMALMPHGPYRYSAFFIKTWRYINICMSDRPDDQYMSSVVHSCQDLANIYGWDLPRVDCLGLEVKDKESDRG